MGELNDVAQAFLDCVGQADLDFVQRLKDEGGSWEKALQPAGSTENALQVEPPPTIDVQLEPPLTRDVQLEPPPTNAVSNLFVSLLARRAWRQIDEELLFLFGTANKLFPFLTTPNQQQSVVDLVDNKEEDEDTDDEEEFAAGQKSKNSRDRVC